MAFFELVKTDPNKVRKEISIEFFRLISLGKPKDGLRFFAADCKTHNPYVVGGMEALFDAMIAVQKQGSEGIIKGSKADFKLAIRKVLAEDDIVAVYTVLSTPDPREGGLRQIHLFRFNNDDKIVEYWDITQDIPQNAANATEVFT